jgi:hydroxyacylglutathione hydrolase
MNTRREFLEHAGAIGLGAVFLPQAGALAAARDERVAEPSPGIVFERFEAGGLSHYSYFIGDTLSGDAAVVDPRRDVAAYVELAKKHRLRIRYAIETHIHADFVSGARELADRTGARIRASVEGGSQYGFPIDPLRDGDVIRVGGVELKAIHTPGHTPEHMSFLASQRGANNRAWALFTGDFLFAGSVGRPDLMGVDNTDRLAKKLWDSLGTAFTELPDELPIYPAHGPGSPCGAGITERDGQATLGVERTSNPAMQFDRRNAFIEDLLFNQPPVPYYWPRMKDVNARGPEVLGGVPEPEPLEPEAYETMIASPDVQLLDTRYMFGFGGGHIAGAVNIGHAPSISMWGGWLLDHNRPIALVKAPEGTATDVTAWLMRVGLTNVKAVLEGGMKEWTMSGRRFATLPQMSIHTLRERLKDPGLQIVDVRQPREWDEGHLAGARYAFLPEIPNRLGEFDRSKPVVTYCGTGYRASIGASLFKRGGFDAYSVPGSMGAWEAANYPIATPTQPQRASLTRRG